MFSRLSAPLKKRCTRKPARANIQIKRNDVTPAGGGTTTFRYTWNADGTLATKTDGTNNWVYNWDSDGDQRLLSVVYNGTTQAAYTYDRYARMLTRTVSAVVTAFEWDKQTCIRETTSGAATRYYAPWKELLSFERGGVTYQVVNDALGSVRLVTDNTGSVVAKLDYDAFGNLLSTSTDSVPGGMPYRYVGAAGCRWDSATGLIYMRQRWYDPTLQRFLSRDPFGTGSQAVGRRSSYPKQLLVNIKDDNIKAEIASTLLSAKWPPISRNLYSYAWNNPIGLEDPTGLGDALSEAMKIVQDLLTNHHIALCVVSACTAKLVSARRKCNALITAEIVGDVLLAVIQPETLAAEEELLAAEEGLYDACILAAYNAYVICLQGASAAERK